MIRRLPLLAAVAVFLALGARGDEITLKDGSKINGTIVGFEANSFRVKTSYGFAVVRKDQIASIRVSDSAKTPPVPKKSSDDEGKSGVPARSPKIQNSVAANPGKPAGANPAPAPGAMAPAPRKVAAIPLAVSPSIPAATSPTPTAVHESSASLSGAPAAPAAPPPIRERVNGNIYVNETYGFTMFRPPDWDLIAGARTLLPGAITAMGTDDQTTYLLIGQDRAARSLEVQMNATASRLGDIMDNFRPLPETRVNISGSTAIERRFHGTVDQHDWSGVIVLIPRGPLVFTIFGMTYAETDLVQIQENVIARTISSIEFTKQ
jgi:hypothetical protein